MSSSQSNTRTGSHVCMRVEAKLVETRYQLDTWRPVHQLRRAGGESSFQSDHDWPLEGLYVFCHFDQSSARWNQLQSFPQSCWESMPLSFDERGCGCVIFQCKEPSLSASDCAQLYILPLSWNARQRMHRLSPQLQIGFFFSSASSYTSWYFKGVAPVIYNLLSVCLQFCLFEFAGQLHCVCACVYQLQIILYPISSNYRWGLGI